MVTCILKFTHKSFTLPETEIQNPRESETSCYDRHKRRACMFWSHSAAGRPRDRGIVLHVNTVCPTEVKIVPSSIIPQQSQRWLSQKQYLDMAADVPKQAQEDRPASVTFGITRIQGEWKSWKQCGLWGHLRESARASLCLNSRHSTGGSDL